jgi:uncharacterized membrane protein
MKFFTKFGDLILKIFEIIGMIILAIPQIPNRLRGINTKEIKDRVDSEVLKENITRIKNDTRVKDGISKISKMEISDVSNLKEKFDNPVKVDDASALKSQISGEFTSEEKESTIFRVQIFSGIFLVISMLYVFSFLSLIIYIILGALTVGYIIYMIYNKVKLMYSADFNAYRDFFLMYIAVGIILVLVGTNPNFVITFSFEFLPSLSILLFAVISVLAVFLIFRIRYHRNYTFGTVIETGKKTAYVKVDYDICSNVKPDVYIVNNSANAKEEDKVKISIEDKIFTNNGNKPVDVIEILNK